MTEEKILTREYTIPLRRAWIRVPQYRRVPKAVKEIKKFIAKHMKIPGRDIDKVKMDIYFNNELWFRGRASPPSRIKVRAIKEGENVRVELAEMPTPVKFLKNKHEKRVKSEEKKVEEKKEEKIEKKQELQNLLYLISKFYFSKIHKKDID